MTCRIKILKKIVVILMILVSGSQFFFKDYGSIFIPLFVLFSFVFFIKAGGRMDRGNIFFLLLVVFWLLFNNYVIHGGVNTNIVFSCVLLMMGSFFAISSFNYYEFRNLLLKYMTYLSALSIVIQLLHDNSFDIPSVSKDGIHLSFLFFNTEWDEGRLSSIFWEPGMYQIVIMFTLCLFVDEFRRLNKTWFIVKKYGILLLALVLTKSTMGYIVFAIFLLFLLIDSSLYKKKSLLIPISFVFISLGILMWRSTAIQDKVAQNESQVATTSLVIRMNDNLSLLQMTTERPWVGYGMDTRDYDNRNKSLDNLSASNGWLNASACNGILYLLLFLSFLYKGLKRQNNCKYPFLFFIVLVLSQCNEYLITFPYMFMYIFRFNNYSAKVNS